MILPRELGVMTLSGATLFPNALLPLYIFEPRYRRMLADALASHRLFCVAMQKPTCTRETPELVAGLGLIRVSVQHSDGTSHLVLQGMTRVELGPASRYRPYRIQQISELKSDPSPTPEVDALAGRVRELFAERLDLGLPPLFPAAPQNINSQPLLPSAAVAREMLRCVADLRNPEHVADMIASAMLPCARERQTILAAVEIRERLRLLAGFLMAEIHRRRQNGGSHA
jgi:Lon protease-like protein